MSQAFAETEPVFCRIRLERNNWYRLQRAIEVILTCQGPPCEHAMPLNADPADLDYYDFRCFFSTPTAGAFARIDERVGTWYVILRIFRVCL
jgi:tRNA dimethylallyltransferase